MPSRKVAEKILAAIGGTSNLRACGICATRLRILVNDPASIDRQELLDTHGVLGVFTKGRYGLELVLGPRLVAGVADSIYELTGIRSSIDELSGFDTPPAQESIVINVTESTLPAPEEVPETPAPEPEAADPVVVEADDESDGIDGDGIDDLLMELEGDADELPRSVLVINGPNLNMLGIREPSIYGLESYAQLVELCKKAAEEAGFDACECLQSNHEGDLVDYIQQALGVHDGIVINPGAYTHTSVALLDALKAVQIPTVEVHISKVNEREAFRQISYIREACIATVAGRGIDGYREAISILAQHLGI